MVLDADDPDTISVGSFFVNPIVARSEHDRLAALAGGRAPGFDAGEGRVKIPAAWLIERSGLDRGHADGRVGISSKHPLAIVNRGGASTREVLRFAVKVKRAVLDWCGVWLTTEPVFVGLDDDADVEFLQKARD
jgi:UDP-N-acetylmuramate dehydrogenase